MEKSEDKKVKKNTGKEYEEFIAFVYELAHSEQFKSQNIILYKDVKINARGDFAKTGRQFDVYWQTETFGTITRYAIECKDYKNKISVEKIDAFVTKTRSCNINKSLFVTNSGFQEGCYEVAKANGIDLLVISNFDDYAKRKNIVTKINTTINFRTKQYLQDPLVKIIISPEYEKDIDCSQWWFVQTYIEINKESINILDYINSLIDQNYKNEIENQKNTILKEYNENVTFIYKNQNEKIPIKGAKIDYIFKYDTNNKYMVAENPNLYEVLAVIEKVNLDNLQESNIEYIKKDVLK
jgi:hypothetical protein